VKDRAPAIDAHAYVDNCLSPTERKAFEARLRQDEDLRRRVDLWRTQGEAIRAAFGAPGYGAQSKPAISPSTNPATPNHGETAESGLRLFPRTRAPERVAPKWISFLRRPATRVFVVLIGITLFPGAMAPAPRAALAETGASSFRAFSSSPEAALDFGGGSVEGLSHALGPQFSTIGLSEWATPLGWTLRGAKRVPGLHGEAILILLEGQESQQLGVLVEPLDAPASSAIRTVSLGGMTVAAFTRQGFGFAVAGLEADSVEAWLSATGFMDEAWPQAAR